MKADLPRTNDVPYTFMSVLFAAGLLFAAVASLWDATAANYMRWYILTWGTAFALILIGATRSKALRTILVLVVPLFGFYLSLATLLSGAVGFNPLEIRFRTSLWLENPNLLAAALVISGVAGTMIQRSPWGRVLLTILVLMAVITTGSRTGLLALVVALAIRMSITLITRRQFRNVWPALGAIGIALVIWQLNLGGSSEASLPPQNLIYPTDHLGHKNWRQYGTNIQVELLNEAGPADGGRVVRLTGEARPGSHLILVQSRGIAPPGYQYVASVYVKAHQPQEIQIGANFTVATCTADSEWSRCVTPVATGNGEGHIQLQIRTAVSGGEIDVFLWGPQIEGGAAVGKVQHRPANLIETLRDSGFLARMHLLSAISNTDDERYIYTQRAWNAFVSSPIMGVGFRNIAAWEANNIEAPSDGHFPPFTHAHNLIVQHLGEVGIVGFLSFAIPFLGVAAVAISSSLRALPLVVAVLILNIGDYTFYNAGGFYVYWLSTGLMIRSRGS